MNLPFKLLPAAVATLLFAVSTTAGAVVRREGVWPAADKKVSFEHDGSPSQGLKKLADEAGWSLVVSKSIAIGEQDVHIDVEDQPADAVLEALFAEGNVVATRSGQLVTITPGASKPPLGAGAPWPPLAPPPPPASPPPASPPGATDAPPSPPPVPTVRGEDRNIFGGSLVVPKGEILHTVTVTGGSARVEGTLTGDLIVAGGSAKILEGGRVVGNVTVFGGSVEVERGARIDGDVGLVGGSLKREDGSFVGGHVVPSSEHGSIRVTAGDEGVSTKVTPFAVKKVVADGAHSFGQRLSKMAVLFVFGCVLLALSGHRVETLRREIASRPMRSLAMGLVGAFAGGFAIVAMCVTVVGIPFAIVALLVGAFAVYAALTAALTTFGAAVFGHKTQNAYVHLLIGCAAFLVLGLIPVVGGLVTAAVTLIAIGSLLSTNLAGYLRPPSRGTL